MAFCAVRNNLLHNEALLNIVKQRGLPRWADRGRSPSDKELM